MAITTIFDLSDMTQEQYDQVIKNLDASGLGAPNGRLHHVASASGNGILIVDVWESEETLGKFSEGLIPMLVAAGVTPVEPRILQIHNIIKG
ncbi:MAG: hypothetical protein IIB30_06825 [Chloroflexi bacterium]|nr:hypothetical protein [Chloroflexota bacterium]